MLRSDLELRLWQNDSNSPEDVGLTQGSYRNTKGKHGGRLHSSIPWQIIRSVGQGLEFRAAGFLELRSANGADNLGKCLGCFGGGVR